MCLASYQFRVWGPRGWIVPTGNETETYNQWAQRNRFHVDDDLYFKYKKQEDSVLLVTQAAYETCNTSNPIAYYDDGNTVIKLRHSGPFYFISGTYQGFVNSGSRHENFKVGVKTALSPSVNTELNSNNGVLVQDETVPKTSEKVEEFIEKAIFNCRFLTLMAVASSD
jgi:hypothetical protein